MAKHVEQLNHGSANWNAWRSIESIRPDLTTAVLRDADLRGFDLHDTTLRSAKLVNVT